MRRPKASRSQTQRREGSTPCHCCKRTIPVAEPRWVMLYPQGLTCGECYESGRFRALMAKPLQLDLPAFPPPE